MLKTTLLGLCFLVGSAYVAPNGAASVSEELMIKEVAESGRCADLAQDPDARVSPPAGVMPGQPPVLSFRYYEGKMHYRFNSSDLILDDAGH